MPKIAKFDVEAVSAQYAELLEEQKRIEEEKSRILAKAREAMIHQDVEELGPFRLIHRETYSWKLEDLQEARPRDWKFYVQPDSKLLKLKMEDDKMFERIAIKKETEVITYVR